MLHPSALNSLKGRCCIETGVSASRCLNGLNEQEAVAAEEVARQLRAQIAEMKKQLPHSQHPTSP